MAWVTEREVTDAATRLATAIEDFCIDKMMEGIEGITDDVEEGSAILEHRFRLCVERTLSQLVSLVIETIDENENVRMEEVWPRLIDLGQQLMAKKLLREEDEGGV